MRPFLVAALVAAVALAGAAPGFAPAPAEPEEMELYFTQLLQREGTFPLQVRECDPGGGAGDYPPSGEMQKNQYQLVRKMQEICTQIDQSVSPKLVQLQAAAVFATASGSRREIDDMVETLVRAHVLMKLGAAILRYDDLYALHSQLINDTLRRFTYPKELDEILQSFFVGFEKQSVLELHRRLVRRYERYRNDAVRMRIAIDRSQNLRPLQTLALTVSNEGTASQDARTFAESLSLQLCQPIVANHHLKHYVEKAEEANLNFQLTDYFSVEVTDLAKVRFVQEALKAFRAERNIVLRDGFTDPRLTVGGSTGELERSEYASVSVPVGKYLVYTRDTKPVLPVEPNLVVSEATEPGKYPTALLRIADSGSGVTVSMDYAAAPQTAAPAATTAAPEPSKPNVVTKPFSRFKKLITSIGKKSPESKDPKPPEIR